jgi:efflux transporter, outer membrane factor (OMF) lipoprotein, NodT family
MSLKQNIKKIVLLGVILSVGLSSCQVTNKYKTPETSKEDLYRDVADTDTTTIANIPWREYFSDAILVNLIEEGLTNNFDLQMAFERIQQAEAGLSIARAAYFPNLALVGQMTHTRTSDASSTLGNYNNQFLVGLSASWEIDLWGKMNRQSRAKYAAFLNSHAGKNLVQTSVISNIALSYYSLLALDEQLNVTNETIKLLQESVETMQALKDAGQLNSAAVEQSKSLLYQTQASVPALEIQIRKLENSLSTLVGRKPGSIARSTIKMQTVPASLQHGIPAQMLAKRPDVQQAELNFRAAFELTNVAQASFYPTIAISTAQIGYGVSSLSSFMQPENLLANIIGGLTQPLFARKQLIGNLKVAKAEQRAALLSFRKTVLAAGEEVSNILFAFEASTKKNAIRAAQVESSEKSVYYTQELLKAGEAIYTEVLSAEQSLLSAQLNQVNDKLEQLQYTVNLYKALGGGIE